MEMPPVTYCEWRIGGQAGLTDQHSLHTQSGPWLAPVGVQCLSWTWRWARKLKLWVCVDVMRFSRGWAVGVWGRRAVWGVGGARWIDAPVQDAAGGSGSD